MASRRNRPPAYDERSQRGPFPTRHHPLDSLPDALIDELALQEAEMQRLTSDNRKLASAHLSMRQDLMALRQRGERIREDIKNSETEGDNEIRFLLEKIAKLEANIRAKDAVKKELLQAHDEAQSLVSERIELSEKIQQAMQELEGARADVKKLPEMQAELESLKKEHQKLRKTFEQEKSVNIAKVEEMKNLEKDLIQLSEQVERLRADLSNAKKRANVPTPPPPAPPQAPPPQPPPQPPPPQPPPPPYSAPYMNQEYAYPQQMYPNGGYVVNYGGPNGQMVGGYVPEVMNQYPYGGFVAVPPPAINPGWGGGMRYVSYWDVDAPVSCKSEDIYRNF